MLRIILEIGSKFFRYFVVLPADVSLVRPVSMTTGHYLLLYPTSLVS